jgi:hypothetical protein
VSEDFQVDVAALFGPFVVLLGEHGADEMIAAHCDG